MIVFLTIYLILCILSYYLLNRSGVNNDNLESYNDAYLRLNNNIIKINKLLSRDYSLCGKLLKESLKTILSNVDINTNTHNPTNSDIIKVKNTNDILTKELSKWIKNFTICNLTHLDKINNIAYEKTILSKYHKCVNVIQNIDQKYNGACSNNLPFSFNKEKYINRLNSTNTLINMCVERLKLEDISSAIIIRSKYISIKDSIDKELDTIIGFRQVVHDAIFETKIIEPLLYDKDGSLYRNVFRKAKMNNLLHHMTNLDCDRMSYFYTGMVDEKMDPITKLDNVKDMISSLKDIDKKIDDEINRNSTSMEEEIESIYNEIFNN